MFVLSPFVPAEDLHLKSEFVIFICFVQLKFLRLEDWKRVLVFFLAMRSKGSNKSKPLKKKAKTKIKD